MARALSQEEVLDFLCRAGGRASNAALLGHFSRFLRDPTLPPEQRLRHRDCFKRYVNSVAVVREEARPGAPPAKFVVLRARYRDLLGEEEAPPAGRNSPCPQEGWSPETKPPTPGEGIAARDPECWKGQAAEPPRTFTASCGAEDSRSHACLAGKLQALAPGPPLQHGFTQGLEAVSEVHCHTTGASRPDDRHWQGARTPPRGLSVCPSSDDTSPSSPQILRDISPPCLPSTGVTVPLHSCLPPSQNISQPYHSTSQGISHPNETTLRDVSPSYPSSNEGAYFPCPSPTGISPPHPPSLRSASPPCPTFSEFRLLVCPPSPGKGSLQCPPSPGTTPPPCPPLHLYIRSGEEWPPFYPPPFLNNPPVLPRGGTEGGWWGQLPVFKSIRCQLSLQDLDDFVEQATNESNESDSCSGSESSSADKHQEDRVGKFAKCTVETKSRDTCTSNLIKDTFKENGAISRRSGYERSTEACEVPETIPAVVTRGTLNVDLMATVLPLIGESQRLRKSALLRDKISSSDDELIDLECRKKSRWPSHSKKASKMSAFTSEPGVDLRITLKPVGTNQMSAGSDFSAQKAVLGPDVSREVAWSESKKASSHKSSLVPLDPKEHDWVVKLASGSWMQVYGLFTEDPHLALRRDFISGYTALHWIAKHGNSQMFRNFVSGAEKAGVKLDANVKSNGGYTPLHLAAIHGHEQVIKLLVEKLKVKVTVRDHSGKRPWQYLCSTTTGEVWQLLGAPNGQTIFPVRALPTIDPASKNTSRRDGLTKISRKASLAAIFKPQHPKCRLANREHLPAFQEVYSD